MPALAASASVASRVGGAGLAGRVGSLVVGLDLADCDGRGARDR